MLGHRLRSAVALGAAALYRARMPRTDAEIRAALADAARAQRLRLQLTPAQHAARAGLPLAEVLALSLGTSTAGTDALLRLYREHRAEAASERPHKSP